MVISFKAAQSIRALDLSCPEGGSLGEYMRHRGLVGNSIAVLSAASVHPFRIKGARAGDGDAIEVFGKGPCKLSPTVSDV